MYQFFENCACMCTFLETNFLETSFFSDNLIFVAQKYALKWHNGRLIDRMILRPRINTISSRWLVLYHRRKLWFDVDSEPLRMTLHSCVKECSSERSQAPAFRVARKNDNIPNQMFYWNLIIELSFILLSNLSRNFVYYYFYFSCNEFVCYPIQEFEIFIH